jgi:hypothetical protein
MAENSVVVTNSGTAVKPSATDEYAKRWGVAQQYIVTLRVDQSSKDEAPIEFATSMDESLSLSMRSEWSYPFANIMQESMEKGMGALQQRNPKAAMILKTAGKAADAAGYRARTRVTSAQVWQSSSPISFNIPFTFIAVKDPETEVKEKVRSLLKLVAPTEVGKGAASILKAPGPSLIDAARGEMGMEGRRITLTIGTFLTLYNCIVRSVDVQFDNIMGVSGTPHKAKATVDIESYYTCFTTQDIDSLFDKVPR